MNSSAREYERVSRVSDPGVYHFAQGGEYSSELYPIDGIRPRFEYHVPGKMHSRLLLEDGMEWVMMVRDKHKTNVWIPTYWPWDPAVNPAVVRLKKVSGHVKYFVREAPGRANSPKGELSLIDVGNPVSYNFGEFNFDPSEFNGFLHIYSQTSTIKGQNPSWRGGLRLEGDARGAVIEESLDIINEMINELKVPVLKKVSD